MYVNKFKRFAVQTNVPNSPDYSYFFEKFSYVDNPWFNNPIKAGWFKGKVVDSNNLIVEFKSDAGANFYGFDMVWRFMKPATTTTPTG